LSVDFALFAGAEEDCVSGGREWRGHFSKDGRVWNREPCSCDVDLRPWRCLNLGSALPSSRARGRGGLHRIFDRTRSLFIK
jgi:hypothetical protein